MRYELHEHSHHHDHAHGHHPGEEQFMRGESGTVPCIGIGGPVGSGKTALIEALVPILLEHGRRPVVIILTVHPDASVITGEILLPGRVARDEMHAYSLYYTDIEARSPDGTLLFADRLKLDPSSASARSPGLLGPYVVLAALYVITQQFPTGTLVDRLHHCMAIQSEVLAGVSELPNNCGAIVRILGHTSVAVERAMRLAWNEARLALLDIPAPDLRKM